MNPLCSLHPSSFRLHPWSILALCAVVGCDGITIEPSCPAELRVGDSGVVAANETDPGAIPTYRWEVFPSDAGTFVDSSAKSTAFQALAEGDAVIRLTASDGLYQVISQCRTAVSGFAEVAVSLVASPNPAEIDETVTLTCTSVGIIEATTLSIVQVDGMVVELTDAGGGVATLTATESGDRIFRCVGEDEDGEPGEPTLVTVSVLPPADDNENENDNDNTAGNENTNENENTSTNENENGSGNDNTGSNENDNTQDNGNDNEADNGNDNGGRLPGRPGR